MGAFTKKVRKKQKCRTITTNFNQQGELLTDNDGIYRSKERTNETGEVFTPDSVVVEMMNRIPPQDWANPTKTFLDPTCGNGQILCNILKKRLACGVPKVMAIATLYGVELMQDNVDLCKERIREILGGTHEYDKIIDRNIVCHDFFDWDFERWAPKRKSNLF